ncbi:16S rRNA (adenine(1518)-N(6)/adenine(1519)-N(6))-dimethyltransferase RsmA [Chloracidobacterium sp. MS 40/45]|uniref:16S rRNA (adenine(1518)-N(6)/adenine(1519)-N(6))- dimethyltransferase RsmA n=1 Tax=Chloracidobacterium aggregatum TaxID=2851959 RepID=UPI001B8AAD74|nr:16S rRNA (adenine(1518)-N(6)/adenine(1519)-N(6))-dimethyltransferase RsmA [Chloracidobacterium aggregatum]QUV99410.1 16S rRNA (adenine(1518)-N(6)/adenine(1519)-N(6))-dimethyltransferase RsmA [Chloracidobacterium sp. MS 40/45]
MTVPDALPALPPPRKRFGQHFLRDRQLLARIVAAAEVGPDDLVVEIGPGRGALTEVLLERAAGVIAFELDRDLAAWLSTRFTDRRWRLHVGDVLEADLAACVTEAGGAWGLASAPVKVVANVPYNLSTPIVEKLLAARHLWTDIVLMLQREVVWRLAAAPGTKDYGYFSVVVQAVCEVTRLFDVPPGAFQPPPKVMSSVVRLTPRPVAIVSPELMPYFCRVVSVAFEQRRKMLGGSLMRLGLSRADLLEGLARAGIAPERRPETLSVGAFACLAQSLAATAAATGALHKGA